MPTVNTFRPQKIKEPKKLQFTIGAFRGVDYRPIQLQVKDYNATDIKNFIYRDNANQKRMGYEHLITMPREDYLDMNGVSHFNNSNRVNGLWEFVDSKGIYHLIAHIGNLLYEIKNIDGAFYNIQYSMIKDDISGKTLEMLDEISGTYSAFASKGVLYILSGVKYYALFNGTKDVSDVGIQYGDLVFIEVANSSIAYIPTTTIGITYKDSPVSMNTSLDKVNLLSNYRKNKLVSGTFVEDGESTRTTAFYDYELDSNIDSEGLSIDDQNIADIEVSITEYKLNLEV